MAGKDLASRLRRHRVTFQTPPAEDADGRIDGDWTNYAVTASVAAEVLPTGGREAVIAGAARGAQTWRVTVRYRDDVATGDRIVWEGRHLDIHSAADPEGDRRALVIYATSGIPT